MASTSVSSLLDALRQHGLLEPAQLEQVAKQVKGRQVEPRALAQKLIQHGWLTAYQVNQLMQGRGQELVLGSYVLLDKLGEGGMGQVFKARHRKLGRVVALKLIRKDRLANGNAIKRFHREIQLAAQLNHPNIVLAFDADQIQDAHFFTMEYVDGIDLAQQVKRSGPLPIAAACDFIRQAALGLQHASDQGLVHRDIKPSNLLLSPKDGTIKILDLGLARMQGALGDSGGGLTLTQDNAVIGTPDYMAPEQILDARAADIRADLYSLGCTLYFLLAEQVPFAGGSLGEKLVKHQLQEPTAIEKLRPEVPAELSAVVRKLLAKKPAERYQTPAQLAAALATLSKGASGAIVTAGRPRVTAIPDDTVPSGSALRRLGAPGRRLGIVAGLLLLVAAGVALFFLFRPGSQPIASTPVKAATEAATKTSATPKATDPPRMIVNSLDAKLVLIPAGQFMMGSPDDEPGREPREGPRHEVAISQPFYLGMHEVTVGEFRAFVQATGYQTEGERDGTGAHCYGPKGETYTDPKVIWKERGWPQTDAHPVSCVTRGDATAFCQWLSKKEGKTYRLPTEAEWEYACRAGTATAFHVGDALTVQQARFNPNTTKEIQPIDVATAKVGSYPANAFGLHDMHGNVWELCADGYDENYYRNSPRQDPPGAGGGDAVMRGGGLEVGPASCRSAFRFPLPPSMRHVVIGFRVVCER